MKHLMVSFLLAAAPTLSAQPAATSIPPSPVPEPDSLVARTAPAIVERGPHHRTWRWSEQHRWPDGQVLEEQHGYVELATGMHRLEKGEWVEADDGIQVLADGGAAALGGQHKAVFSANLNTLGATTLYLPDGRRLVSHVLGLVYVDGDTGRSAVIAGVKDSIGQIHPDLPNQVLYPDAFEGLEADVRYTFTRAGFEQDLLLRTSYLPDPESVGIPAVSAKLELWTELVEAPTPTQNPAALSVEPDAPTGQASPLLQDQTLDFGSMQIGSGQAFLVPKEAAGEPIRVNKRWYQQDNRQFLIETLGYRILRQKLDTLPQAASPPRKRTKASPELTVPRVQLARHLPPPPAASPSRRPPKIALLASAPPPRPGLVLDYQTLNSSLTNYTFAADVTYAITGPVYLYGTNRIEGGTVLKFSANAGATICVKGTLLGLTDDYRPAVLTARTDSSFGEYIGSSPSGAYATIALDFDYNTSATLASLRNLRIAYAATALRFSGGTGHEIRHLQIYNCGTAANSVGGDYALRNVLAWNLTNAATASGAATGRWEHVTFDQVTNLAPSGVLCLTNCLLTGVVNTNTFTGQANTVLSTSNGVYQVVGGGKHYLAASSPYRDAGTTNINATLAAELKTRTTYAPVVLTNLATSVTLTPVAGRDTDVPDQGFHYSPLDFWGCGVTLSNMTLLATNGVAIGVDFASSSWGFICKSARIISQGSPLNFNHLVRAHCVQEQGGGNPGTRSWYYDGSSTDATCEFRLRFTEYAQLMNDGSGIHNCYKTRAFEWTHSRIYNFSGAVNTIGGNTITGATTNSLWERGGITFGWGSSSNTLATMHLRNNLFRFAAVAFGAAAGNPWTVRDNLFEQSIVNSTCASDHIVRANDAGNWLTLQ